MIVINEMILSIFSSVLIKPSKEVSLSLKRVARNNPVMIPASEKMLLRNPFFNPNKAGNNTMTQIMMSNLFKLFKPFKFKKSVQINLNPDSSLQKFSQFAQE